MLDRLVTQIEPLPDHIADQEPRTLRDFLSAHTVILLADPGVGKTHLFQHAAQQEVAEYTTVRQFVSFEGEDWKSKTVYLDAFDEVRSRGDSQDTGGRVPAPPQEMTRPNSAPALERALRLRIPEDKVSCLDVIALDVTPPAATKKTRAKNG